MKTEHRFAEALKEMMSETSLDNISVTALCKKCKVNRQTFYYHFHNFYDLLTLVYLDEKITAVETVKNIRELMKAVFDHSIKNNNFVMATISSAGKDLYEEFVYNHIYKGLLRLIGETPEGKKIHTNDRKSIARFYSLGFAHSFVYYVSTHKNKHFENLMNTFAFLGDNILENAVKKYIEIKGKEK